MAITTQFLTGFEHGFIGTAATAGGGLFDTVTAGITASTSSPRNGAYCCHLVGSASTLTNFKKTIPSTTAIVVRFGLKVTVRPPVVTYGQFVHLDTASALGVCGIGINDIGVLRAFYTGATNRIGPTIDTTGWHLIELQVDTVAGTLAWKVDGVAQTAVTGATNHDAITKVGFGQSVLGPTTITADYDDLIVGTWTNAATDWYGDGKVLAQPAGVDGTHATITSLSPGDAGTAYSGTPTTVNTMVDDPPGTLGWTATRSTTDNIALRTATVGAYAEIKPAPTAETGQANFVRALLSYSSVTATANLAACDIRNSAGTVTPIWGTTGGTGADFSENTNFFKAAIVTPPAAGWTAAEINALRWRFGGCTSVDVSPVPTVQALMLEVDWPISVAGPIYNDTASGTIVATGTGIETYEPPAAGTVYTDAQTGVITATGTALETAAATDLAAGTLTASGSGVEVYQPPAVYTDTRTGTATATGTSTETAAAADSTTGAIAAAGTATEFAAGTDTATGILTATGSGLEEYEPGGVVHIDATAGELTATGTAVESAAYDDTQTAGPALAGTGSETYQPPTGDTIYTDATAGTITGSGTGLENTTIADDRLGTATTSGTGTDAHTRTTAATGAATAAGIGIESAVADDAAAGITTASGSGTETYQPPAVHVDAAAGTLTATGTAADSHTSAHAPTGVIAATGAAQETATATDTQAGAVALTGTSTENATRTYHDTATGTLTATGTGTDLWLPTGPQHVDAQTGAITATGSSLELRTYEDGQTGGPTLQGDSQHSTQYADTCPGTIRAHGTGTLTTTRQRHRTGHPGTGEPVPPYPAWPTPGTLRRPRRSTHPVGAAGRQRTLT